MTNTEIINFLKNNPLDRYIILAALLEDDTISIAELVKHKEDSLGKQQERRRKSWLMHVRLLCVTRIR